jgi:hypothetical protein
MFSYPSKIGAKRKEKGQVERESPAFVDKDSFLSLQ